MEDYLNNTEVTTHNEKREELARFCRTQDSCDVCPLYKRYKCNYYPAGAGFVISSHQVDAAYEFAKAYFKNQDEVVDEFNNVGTPNPASPKEIEKALDNESPEVHNEAVFKDGHKEDLICWTNCEDGDIRFAVKSGSYLYRENSVGHWFFKKDEKDVFIMTDEINYLTWNPDDMNEPAEKPHILDSGTRREFETGAVRDIQEGKGRCDLLPLDVIGHILCNPTLAYIYKFQLHNDTNALYDALTSSGVYHNQFTMYLEVSKHFEEGAKKYGEYNWQKGIPTHCYIDSAVRHYLKWLRGDKDEPHDRAFCWNILCCIWTCNHKPELNTYAKEKENEQNV